MMSASVHNAQEHHADPTTVAGAASTPVSSRDSVLRGQTILQASVTTPAWRQGTALQPRSTSGAAFQDHLRCLRKVKSSIKSIIVKTSVDDMYLSSLSAQQQHFVFL